MSSSRRIYLLALCIAITLILFVPNASSDTTTNAPQLQHGQKENILVTCVNIGTVPQAITIKSYVTGTFSGPQESQQVDPGQVLTPSTAVSLGQLGVGQKQSKEFTVTIPTYDAAPNFAYSGLAITFECHGTQYGNPVGDVFSRTTVKVAIAGDSSSASGVSTSPGVKSGLIPPWVSASGAAVAVGTGALLKRLRGGTARRWPVPPPMIPSPSQPLPQDGTWVTGHGLATSSVGTTSVGSPSVQPPVSATPQVSLPPGSIEVSPEGAPPPPGYVPPPTDRIYHPVPIPSDLIQKGLVKFHRRSALDIYDPNAYTTCNTCGATLYNQDALDYDYEEAHNILGAVFVGLKDLLKGPTPRRFVCPHCGTLQTVSTVTIPGPTEADMEEGSRWALSQP